MTFMGNEQVIIPLTKIECGSSGCAEITTQSGFHKSVSKTCMSLVKLDLESTSSEIKVVDLNKCNSNYSTKVKVPGIDVLEDINVSLKCSRPPNFIGPNGKIFKI